MDLHRPKTIWQTGGKVDAPLFILFYLARGVFLCAGTNVGNEVVHYGAAILIRISCFVFEDIHLLCTCPYMLYLLYCFVW